MIDLLLLTHLLNTCNFIPKDRFLGFLTIEIRLRKIPVVAICMLAVSLLFWYVGLMPDLGTLRDRTKNPMGRALYGIMAMGWRVRPVTGVF